MRLICASNRIATAKPAASSSGEIIFEPEDRRALLWADVFVLITIKTPSMSHPVWRGFELSRHPCRAVKFTKGIHHFSLLTLLGCQLPVLRRAKYRHSQKN